MMEYRSTINTIIILFQRTFCTLMWGFIAYIDLPNGHAPLRMIVSDLAVIQKLIHGLQCSHPSNLQCRDGSEFPLKDKGKCALHEGFSLLYNSPQSSSSSTDIIWIGNQKWLSIQWCQVRSARAVYGAPVEVGSWIWLDVAVHQLYTEKATIGPSVCL